METYVKKLKEICENHPFEEKIVIVNSYQTGKEINDAFLGNGCSAINLKYRTIGDLAIEAIEKRGELKDQLARSVGIEFMSIILTKLKDQQELSYFQQMEITPSFCQQMFETMIQLRMAGYDGENIPTSSFLTEEKGRDLKTILTHYEKMLHDHQLMDSPLLFKKAIELGEAKKNRIFIIQPHLRWKYLEELFFLKIKSHVVYQLSLSPVYGIDLKNVNEKSIEWGEETPFSYIYDLENRKEKGEMETFSAMSEEGEGKWVIEKIKNEKIPFDQAVIFYTNEVPYVSLFYHLSQTLNIPMTFGEGLPIFYSRPGRFVFSLIKWIRSNYSVNPFIHMIQDGLFSFEEDAPSKSRMVKLLRDLQIGWGQDRYLMKLEQEMNHFDLLIENTTDEEKKDYFIKRRYELAWLHSFFTKIFSKLPPLQEEMNGKVCLEGILRTLTNFCTLASPHDHMAKDSIINEIETILPYIEETITPYDLFEKINRLLEGIRIQSSSPKPGHLHVTTYKKGIYNSRNHVFIVGLDNRKFPGAEKEDPLLLDVERINLGKNIPLRGVAAQENLYIMLQLLANTKGAVRVSFCQFDIPENQGLNPSHLFLQCTRYVKDDESIDFKQLKEMKALLVPKGVLEEKDFWLQQLTSPFGVQMDDQMFQPFPHLQDGFAGLVHRSKGEMTSYDGNVNVDEKSWDPRQNPQLTMTAGKLERLAACPYSFFIQEVLGIKPVEDISFDPNKWLDGATRGTLLHRVFELFYKQLNPGEKPNYEQHRQKIEEIAWDLLEKQKEFVPPPNERIFEKEAREIIESCHIFLKEEEKYSSEYEPVEFEYRFGFDGLKRAEVTLPSGEKIYLSGMIDRIDRNQDGKYQIIDYKTGSTYSYEENEPFKGGRQLQHVLYSLAIEKHLNLPEGSVIESSYYFPTTKGLAKRIVRKQDETVRTNGKVIIEHLTDLLKTGTFTMTDDGDDCKFCDYQSICRRHFYHEEILKEKQSDPSKEGLRRFKGVRAYD